MKLTEDFRTRFEKALAYADMKAVDLARATGISEATISQYRSGYSTPKRDRLALIADKLGVNPVWLMGLDAEMTPGAAAPTTSAEEMANDPLMIEVYQLRKSVSDERFRAYVRALAALVKEGD